MDDEKIVKEALIALVKELKGQIEILNNKLESSEECEIYLLRLTMNLDPGKTREIIVANNDDLYKLTKEQIVDYLAFIDNNMDRYLKD